MSKYKWQGEKVEVRFGLMHVTQNTEKPLYWYNYEYNNARGSKSLIDAVEITTTRSTFYISNHFGVGVHKLLKGGWPSHAHFSFDKSHIFEEYVPSAMIVCPKIFDELGYSRHEALRRIWQKENYPQEFEKNERLRILTIKH